LVKRMGEEKGRGSRDSKKVDSIRRLKGRGAFAGRRKWNGEAREEKYSEEWTSMTKSPAEPGWVKRDSERDCIKNGGPEY